ncbi:endonuclease subunit UvrC [Spirochaetia bacterium]|nr:endonuclease subunit UvrC [Spirochaetia bacterium]
MKKILFFLKALLGIIIGTVIFAVVLILYLTVREYRPKNIEPVTIRSGENRTLSSGRLIHILTWNIGYAALGASEDFFMDGGKMVRPKSKKTVEENIAGILDFITGINADIVLLQEVDINSNRSFRINQSDFLSVNTAYSSAFAHNYRCDFVPFPIPPIGKVESGLLTLNVFAPSESVRISLPVPFTWPVKTANLKRCLLVERIPVENKELVLVNFHLEAYESGAGREAQTKILIDFLRAEYAQGNYCIAGGDFNQTFPGASEQYPLLNTEYFIPGTLSPELLPAGWDFVTDSGTPTARLNDKPYSGENQHYVIDGFILSPNIALHSVKTADLGFLYSDHNPVELEIMLENEE